MTKHEHEIKTMLYDLSITPEIKGYHYLVEAITIKEKANKAKDFTEPQMKIYHDIAKKFNTTAANVERVIRHAVQRSCNNKTPLFFTIFGPALKLHKEKITNSCFIAMATEYLAFQEAEN